MSTSTRRRRPAEWPEILTTAEACAFLDVSEPTLRDLRDEHGLPCCWLTTSSPRYLRHEIVAWMSERRRAESVRNETGRKTAKRPVTLRKVN